MDATTWPIVLNTIIYSALGIVIFIIAFFIVDMLTPGKLWEEIEQKQNMAVAIFAGLVALGLAIIVAASVVG